MSTRRMEAVVRLEEEIEAFERAASAGGAQRLRDLLVKFIDGLGR